MPWLRRTDLFGIEEEDVKTLEPGVAVVIISFLWVFSVIGLGCTILLRFNTTRSFRKKKTFRGADQAVHILKIWNVQLSLVTAQCYLVNIIYTWFLR